MFVWAATAVEHRAGRTDRYLGEQNFAEEEDAVEAVLNAVVIALEEAIAGSEVEAFCPFGYQRVEHRQVSARSYSAATEIRARQGSLARFQRCHQCCCFRDCSTAGEHR